jgi:hypothetical protein
MAAIRWWSGSDDRDGRIGGAPHNPSEWSTGLAPASWPALFHDCHSCTAIAGYLSVSAMEIRRQPI